MEEMKVVRLARGLTMKQVGAQAGITESYYCLIEAGKRRPSPAVAKRIGAVLELTTEELWEMFYAGDERRCG